MKKARIRPLALCIFRQAELIFVAEGFDELKQEAFYRPIGGGIDFGETAAETIKREVMEEIKAEVRDVTYLGTLENIFTHNGKQGHEICLIFDAKFVDDFRNQRDYSVMGEDNGDILFTASYKPLSYFREGNAPLYPTGLLELIEKVKRTS